MTMTATGLRELRSPLRLGSLTLPIVLRCGPRRARCCVTRCPIVSYPTAPLTIELPDGAAGRGYATAVQHADTSTWQHRMVAYRLSRWPRPPQGSRPCKSRGTSRDLAHRDRGTATSGGSRLAWHEKTLETRRPNWRCRTLESVAERQVHQRLALAREANVEPGRQGFPERGTQADAIAELDIVTQPGRDRRRLGYKAIG